jgi:hypothetical protein
MGNSVRSLSGRRSAPDAFIWQHPERSHRRAWCDVYDTDYVNAYFDKEFYLVLLNSLYYGIGNLHRILLYSYNSTVLSIMAFDLWEGGQYTYVCALGVLMVLLLIAMAFTARTVGAKVGIAA